MSGVAEPLPVRFSLELELHYIECRLREAGTNGRPLKVSRCKAMDSLTLQSGSGCCGLAVHRHGLTRSCRRGYAASLRVIASLAKRVRAGLGSEDSGAISGGHLTLRSANFLSLSQDACLGGRPPTFPLRKGYYGGVAAGLRDHSVYYPFRHRRSDIVIVPEWHCEYAVAGMAAGIGELWLHTPVSERFTQAPPLVGLTG